MKIFFDTEFTGLYKTTELISIGLIAENGKQIYCEFTNINPQLQDLWIQENVLKNTIYYGNKNIEDIVDEEDYYFGDKIEIKGVLLHWLNQFETIEFVSDVCHYDFTLLIDIFGTAWDLPKNVCPSCYDLNNDIEIYYNINAFNAFDYSRELILSQFNKKIKGEKHNALYDAKVIKTIYESIHKQKEL